MIDKIQLREQRRVARHERIRKNLIGTVARPRLCVYRSLNHLHAQIIDDINRKVLLGLSTQDKDIRKKLKNGGNIDAAATLGQAFAAKAMSQGIKQVSFDRGGYVYHGRVKAFAEAARSGGLEF